MTTADPMVPIGARVLRRRRELADTWTLEIEPEDQGVLRFGPGQFNMLYAFGAGEVPISISGDPARPGTLVHTVRDVGNEKVSKGLSGVAGVAITLAVAGVVFGGLWLVVRRRSVPSSPARSAPAASG